MYSQEKADAICSRVSEGASLRRSCEEVGVSHPSFLRWCDDRTELADQYARARAVGTEVEFEALADLQEELPERGPTGVVDTGWVAWKRLQIDTKKWALSKKAPKKYGEKIEQTHEVGESITKVIREIVYPKA